MKPTLRRGDLPALWDATQTYAASLQQRTARIFADSTTRAGSLLDGLKRNKPLAFATQFLPTGWLITAINGVDTRKSQALVDRLQRWYPEAPPRRIAEKLMLQKSVQSGSVGFVSGLVPGFLAPLLLADLATSAVLMAELIFQIAAVYGKPLDDPQRKGEALAIFGIAFGGQTAVRAGLTAMRAVPLAGAAIGAGTNAALIQALGHAACTFYETGGASLESQAAMEAAIAQEAAWQASVREQEILLDILLVHWHYLMGESRPVAEFVDALHRQAPLEPEAIARLSTMEPQSMEIADWVAQLDPLFAATLLAQLETAVAQQDRIPPAAARMLNLLATQSALEPTELTRLQTAALVSSSESSRASVGDVAKHDSPENS